MKLNWETEIDTPATVAVIGGGAIGIEAALYARFLGYYVLLIEGAKMAQSWRRGGQLPMLVPFGRAASQLGQAALEAHRPDSPLPKQSDVMTGLEFAEKYLVPLARTDLLIDSVHVHSRVVSVSRLAGRRETPGEIQDRADVEFRLAIHSKSRGWFTERADIILDCSGLSVPRALGPGGGIAVGEVEHADLIEPYQIDAGAGKNAEQYAGKRIVLVGASHSALMNLVSLVDLMRRSSQTRITWLLMLEPGMSEPIQWLDRVRATGDAGERLAAREEVQAALRGTLEGVVVLPVLGIERMASAPGGLDVRLQTDEDNTLDIQCDRIVSGCGLQADWSHAAALRVGRSATLDRPTLEFSSVGAAGDASDRSPSASIALSDSILTMEPHYYVIGSKSFGLAHDRFTLAQGHQQIREAFALIGGRSDLDLYRNIQRPSE